MTLSAAMQEDSFLVEAAGWARYYENAREIISQITAARIADALPQEIIDDPPAFRNWVEQCKKIYEAQSNY